jgi:hypothetical protein
MAAVGSCDITYDETRSIRSVVWSWTSSAGGGVSGFDTKPISGELLRFVTNPGATAPTDNYDVTLLDADGVDVLGTQGTDRDTANSEQFPPLIVGTIGAASYVRPVAVNGPLSLVIAAAGDSKQGTITLYYR